MSASAEHPDAAEEDATLLAAASAMVAISVPATGATAARVSATQLRTLTVLAERDHTNLAELATALGTGPSATSRLCDRLISAGLISRTQSERTRREIDLRLTPAGRRLLVEIDWQRLHRLRAVLRRLPAARRGAVLRALGAFADAARPVIAEMGGG